MTDYVGIGVVITSAGSAVASVLAVVYSRGASRNTTTPAGSPPLGELATNTAAAVTTPPGKPTLGETVAAGAETLDHVHEIVCNGSESSTSGAVSPHTGTE